MGVVAGGGHNLGPHYWHGWTTAFLLSEMTGDDAAAAAAWGDRDDENAEPFGAHPNMESAWRYDPERAGDDAATTTALEAFEWDRDDGGGGAPGPGAGGWFDDLSARGDAKRARFVSSVGAGTSPSASVRSTSVRETTV